VTGFESFDDLKLIIGRLTVGELEIGDSLAM
jgi:hypothetical protein